MRLRVRCTRCGLKVPGRQQKILPACSLVPRAMRWPWTFLLHDTKCANNNGNILPAGGEKIFPFSLSANTKEHERKSASIRNAMRQLEFTHVISRSWSPQRFEIVGIANAMHCAGIRTRKCAHRFIHFTRYARDSFVLHPLLLKNCTDVHGASNHIAERRTCTSTLFYVIRPRVLTEVSGTQEEKIIRTYFLFPGNVNAVGNEPRAIG